MPAVAVNTTLMMLSRKASTVCGDDQKRGMLVEGVGRAKNNNEQTRPRGPPGFIPSYIARTYVGRNFGMKVKSKQVEGSHRIMVRFALDSSGAVIVMSRTKQLPS